MEQLIQRDGFNYCETYPKGVIFARWIILTLAFILGVFILSQIKPALGIIYALYALYALTLVLPLSRCVNCFYYGRACNTGWGKVAAYLYGKGDESRYAEHYNYAIFLHLLWVIPLLASFFKLIMEKSLFFLMFFLVYTLVLWIEKVGLKKLACRRCHQREFCPALPFKK
jgi:hypothetical protein